jgi:hypothetical protein
MRVARLRDIASYPSNLALLAHKLRRALRRNRSLATYRARLIGGDFLPLLTAAATPPRLTVGLPVYRVREEHLRAAIDSIRTQSWREWELVIVDDASPDPHVARVLAEAERDDPRIRVHRRSTNGGVAAASNDLVDLARGEYLAFVDHDDLIHARALELASAALGQWPDTDWLFTDEDKIDGSGLHYQPCFKPGFSRRLLLSLNLVTHLRVVRVDTIRRVGCHRRGFDGAQDWDLALRILAGGGRFRHLPGVLYHWRSADRSMASAAAAKPGANPAAARALLDFLARTHPEIEAAVETVLAPASLFRVRMRARPEVPVCLVGSWKGPKSYRPAEMLPATEPSGLDGLIGRLAHISAPVVAVAPPGGLGADDLEPLLEELLLPATGLVGGRLAHRGRVVNSGWILDEVGRAHDPWAGLYLGDPGYLNLALVPGARHLPPPHGWAAWRTALLEGWRAAGAARGDWRLATGMARIGLEVMVTPAVTFAANAGPVPPPEVPPSPGLAASWPHWAEELGLLP